MKKRFHILIAIICVSILFVNILDVSAGVVNISIEGSPTVVVGNTIDLTVKASDITGFNKGLATVQGDLIFDNNYLEYVQYKNASSNLSSSYGTTTQRFVSLGMGGEYISSSDNLITITFRAKKIGTTEVSIKDLVVGDVKAIVHSANASSKSVEIVGEDKTPEKPTTPSKDDDKVGGSSSGGNKPDNKPSTTPSSKSSNNDLESLTINQAKVSPTFSKSTTVYQVVIPNDVDHLQLDYKTADSHATVKVVGNEKLSSGSKHVVKIIVTAEDGSTKTYTLNVERAKDDSNNKLESLTIKESNLSPKFDADINEYRIKLDKNVKKLTIGAIAKDKNSKVEIIDNRDLDRHNSIVLVKVTDKNGFSNYYKLKVEHNGSGKVMLFGINILYIAFGLLFLIVLLFFILLFFKRKEKEEKDVSSKPKRVVTDDLYDDVVTKDELVDAITERDPKKLKMLLTQEEANKLKEEVKKQEQEKDIEATKEELLKAIEENDKKKIMKLVDKEKLNQKRQATDYVKSEDDRIKEEIIKAIEERDTCKLKMIVKQEEANRLKDELRNDDR